MAITTVEGFIAAPVESELDDWKVFTQEGETEDSDELRDSLTSQEEFPEAGSVQQVQNVFHERFAQELLDEPIEMVGA